MPGVDYLYNRQGGVKASHRGSTVYFHPDPGESRFNCALFHRITQNAGKTE
jgi:hypothetical protein